MPSDGIDIYHRRSRSVPEWIFAKVEEGALEYRQIILWMTLNDWRYGKSADLGITIPRIASKMRCGEEALRADMKTLEAEGCIRSTADMFGGGAGLSFEMAVAPPSEEHSGREASTEVVAPNRRSDFRGINAKNVIATWVKIYKKRYHLDYVPDGKDGTAAGNIAKSYRESPKSVEPFFTAALDYLSSDPFWDKRVTIHSAWSNLNNIRLQARRKKTGYGGPTYTHPPTFDAEAYSRKLEEIANERRSK